LVEGTLANGRVRKAVVIAALVAALAFLPAAAHAALFTGPTNFAAGDGPDSVAVGDFNGDFDPDLAVANLNSHGVSILLGGSGGGFGTATAFPAGSNPSSVAVGDFNGDSDPDLAATDASSGNVSILLGGAGGGFGAATTYAVGSNPASVAVADFDGDADLDLAVANSDGVSILLGNGNGTFGTRVVYETTGQSLYVAVGEFNGDSDPDLAVANEGGGVTILYGVAGGGFNTSDTLYETGILPQSVAVGNFNADSHADLAVANTLSDSVSVLVGGAGGSFTGPTDFPAGSFPQSVAVGDFNADSDLDVAVADNAGSGNGGGVSILLGGAGASFTGPTHFAAGEGSSSVAVSDFNGDSQPDLAVANFNSGEVSILLGVPQFTGYPRPKGASPLRVSLVPAYSQCTAPNRTHGSPLAFPSCASPSQTSGYLTVGTPDSNGKGANAIGYVRFAVVVGNLSTPSDEADVRLKISFSDVRRKSDLSDYSGEVELRTDLRITDKENAPNPGGPGPGTVQDTTLTAPVFCTPTSSATIGSTCALQTTVDALYPGTLKEGKRAIWQLDQVRVFDGGSDDLASTTGDNTPFATQGVFVP
jgi:FG-GAP-like repeat/FG-GAP repeat